MKKETGFIIGGVVLLATVFGGSETIFPWYLKVIGGIGLIIYGVFIGIQSRIKKE